MDRRLFLTGMFGLPGAAALATVVKPGAAIAGIPSNSGGILSELDAPLDADTVEDVQYRRDEDRRRRDWYYRRHHHRRPRRRRVWRTVCRRVRRHGRWHRRCWRERVWRYW